MQKLAKYYEEGSGVEKDGEEAKKLYVWISRPALEQSEGIDWEEDGEIEWRFDERNGRLVIKDKGSLDDFSNWSRTSQMKDYVYYLDLPWKKKYEE